MYENMNDNYIIFLNDKFFKKSFFKRSFFKSYYNKIINNLENKGIRVVSKSDIYEYQDRKKHHTDLCLYFDDNKYPSLNSLYIHLFDGNYYNDTIYVTKKIEMERGMLILLAGKLGVRELKYSSIVTETSLSNISGGVNVKGINNMVRYKKEKSVREGISGHELYLNRGAPVYISSQNLYEIDMNIEDTLGRMESNIFSYEFYKTNPKLESFVYKRFEFKMLTLDYTIEVEDISEKSFAVKSCFMDYGIGLMIDKNTCYNEIIRYEFNFFTDREIRIQFIENDRIGGDKFVIIREAYEASSDKKLAVEYICEYVRKESRLCEYTLSETDIDKNKDNFEKELSEWVNNSDINHEEFVKQCHNFISTQQIRTWLYKKFLHGSDGVSTNRVINLPKSTRPRSMSPIRRTNSSRFNTMFNRERLDSDLSNDIKTVNSPVIKKKNTITTFFKNKKKPKERNEYTLNRDPSPHRFS